MSTTPTTIQLNVGGTIYQVSKTLLEKFPGSLLERCASKTWNEEGNEAFIEGDGTRFRQVLDYMRHGEVTLPRGESTASFLKELKYYGIEYDTDKIINSDNLSIPSFIPFSQHLHDDKHYKILNYVVAVITTHIITEATTSMILNGKHSFNIRYESDLTEEELRSKDVEILEKLVISQYLYQKRLFKDEILESINQNISKANLTISTNRSVINNEYSLFIVSSLAEE